MLFKKTFFWRWRRRLKTAKGKNFEKKSYAPLFYQPWWHTPRGVSQQATNTRVLIVEQHCSTEYCLLQSRLNYVSRLTALLALDMPSERTKDWTTTDRPYALMKTFPHALESPQPLIFCAFPCYVPANLHHCCHYQIRIPLSPSVFHVSSSVGLSDYHYQQRSPPSSSDTESVRHVFCYSCMSPCPMCFTTSFSTPSKPPITSYSHTLFFRTAGNPPTPQPLLTWKSVRHASFSAPTLPNTSHCSFSAAPPCHCTPWSHLMW